MSPVELHMLLTLVVGEDESMLGKANVPPLRALLAAYTPEGETCRPPAKKDALVKRVAEAVRAAGTAGFARPPRFDASAGEEAPVGGEADGSS